MSTLKEIARSLVPAQARPPMKRALQAIQWPFLSPLARKIHGFESAKSDEPIQQAIDLPEMVDSAWLALGPVAYQIVKWHRPKVIVELGSHMGFSALAMALALRDLGEGGKLFAVDTWEGDPHSGFYGDHVHDTFVSRIAGLGLGEIVHPLRMLFDEAVDRVPTPVDLLHIDGLHTYEAVSHDLATFGPLVAPGGLVFFHDVNTVYDGVRQFWSEVSRKHESAMIPYSHGLGVLRMKRT